jgi:hypothetical protein
MGLTFGRDFSLASLDAVDSSRVLHGTKFGRLMVTEFPVPFTNYVQQ